MIKASVIGIGPDGAGQCLAAGKYSTVIPFLKTARADKRFVEVWLCAPTKKWKSESGPAVAPVLESGRGLKQRKSE
jgi:hypothetical protein